MIKKKKKLIRLYPLKKKPSWTGKCEHAQRASGDQWRTARALWGYEQLANERLKGLSDQPVDQWELCTTLRLSDEWKSPCQNEQTA